MDEIGNSVAVYGLEWSIRHLSLKNYIIYVKSYTKYIDQDNHLHIFSSQNISGRLKLTKTYFIFKRGLKNKFVVKSKKKKKKHFKVKR